MREQGNLISRTGNINRRTVLRTVGGATVAGIGLTAATGTASAHGFKKVRFCGCTQVCVCGFGQIEVIVANDSNDGDFECRTVHMGGGAPNNFCFEVDCIPVDCDKIVAVRAFKDEDGDGTIEEDEEEIICNPNACAEKALAECVEGVCDRFGETSDTGPCGDKFLEEECNFFED